MISEKYEALVFAFFMALLMSGIMSFVVSSYNLGFVENLIFLWLKAWKFAFIVAFPTVLVVSPIVKKCVSFLVKKPD